MINAHAAYSILNNDDFDPASRYATLTIGYSGMFGALFAAIVDLAAATGVKLDYLSNTRLHSILVKGGKGIEYAYATRQDPGALLGVVEQMRPGWRCPATPSNWWPRAAVTPRLKTGTQTCSTTPR